MTLPSPIPRPSDELLETSIEGQGTVAPATDLEAWVWAEILAPDRPLSNYDFRTLIDHRPRIGFLWIAEVEMRQGKRTLGTCGLGRPTGRRWNQVRQTEQMVRWFGQIPDFVITLDAVFADHALRSAAPQNFLAVLEHELWHCGQELDTYGSPRFDRDDNPIWGIRPHDTEEFAGVIYRYGPAASANAGPLVEAIDYVREHGPSVAPATLEGICGTCARSPVGASVGP